VDLSIFAGCVGCLINVASSDHSCDEATNLRQNGIFQFQSTMLAVNFLKMFIETKHGEAEFISLLTDDDSFAAICACCVQNIIKN